MLTKVNRFSRDPFSGYRNYISYLQGLMRETSVGTDWNTQVLGALNGEASAELRQVATIETRRKYGTYFTGTMLSKRLLARCKSFNSGSYFYDPTCGMGDLLLAAAKKLPLGSSLSQTLLHWGHKLAGTDLHSEFIEGAKTRLVLLARQRHKATEAFAGTLSEYFPNIRVADGSVEKNAFRQATVLLMNPPFGFVDTPVDCNWAGGRISEAAIFIMTALKQIRPGTEVLAILPDVLRSGSFSKHWRRCVSELAEVHMVEPYGIFDDSADVDVFLLRLIRRAECKSTNSKQWPLSCKTRDTTIANYFNVHVGSVIPYRDPVIGPEYGYVHPRCVPTWTIMRKFTETRKYCGSAYEPPFVVVRRTSRPGDKYRAVATIIAGSRSVAVENHLIVCLPKKKTLNSCKHLMTQLKSSATTSFLNKRIRCRHLTVSAVEAIPLRFN
jgi:hypothetical protein